MPPLAQHKQLPLHRALIDNAGPEVVLALLRANPAATSTPDEVSCGADMGRCVCSVIILAGFMRMCFWVLFHKCVHLYMHRNIVE